MRATEGKRNIAGDADGLIGPDLFSDFLIQIDFQKRQLHLTPLPSRDPNPRGYDRVVSPEEKDFSPVFREGSHLFILTKLNNKTSGLFLLDTGASFSNVDSNLRAPLDKNPRRFGSTHPRHFGRSEGCFSGGQSCAAVRSLPAGKPGSDCFQLEQSIRTPGIPPVRYPWLSRALPVPVDARLPQRAREVRLRFGRKEIAARDSASSVRMMDEWPP